jgi:hypothetical protein
MHSEAKKGGSEMNREDRLRQILERLPAQDRPRWIAEANRLVKLVERFRRIKPKKRVNLLTRKKEFGELLRGVLRARCRAQAGSLSQALRAASTVAA